MKRRSRSDNRSERSVEPGARDRQSVMFSNQRHHTGPTEDDRSNYSRMTSMSSQRTSVRAPSLLEASRHRLSIRKLAAFPMQQTAPKPFLACCSDITRYGRDWNAEFQLAWEMDDSTVPQAESRMETLRRIEREFVDAAIRTARQIVTLDDDGPRELPKFLQCYRVDNIFFRVLPDSRSGRNYVASLRGVLQSRTRLLTVPLSCMIFYRGMPVLAQALVPMPPNPTRLYGADSTNDKEVEAEIIHMADALNIPFPDGTLEVYEGLDGRLYLTNSNSTLTPLFVDDTIMKRQEMLRLCCNVTDGHGDTISLLGNAEVLNRIVQACVDSESRAVGERLKKLCDVLHSIGINMCLLKQVLCKAEESGMFPPHVLSRLRELVSIEMLARSVKQEFYLEVQGKRVAYDDEALAGTLSKHIAMVFAKLENFRSLFLEVVAKKYGIVDLDEDIIDSLTSVRTGMKADILARICALIGVSIEKTSQNGTIMKWHAHVNARVLPNLIDPQYVRALSEKYKTVPMKDSFRYAFCLPVRWKVACWDKAYEEALTLVRETMRAQDEISGKVSMPTLHSRRSVCEVCFATMQKNYMAEGRHMFSEAMKGFEKMTGPVTQGRLHIEYGFWLLRVVELYQTDEPATYRACVEEAAGHFFSAIHKLPSYLKSEHGAWLHLQPYKGLLQCKQLLPSCSVNTGELVEHSIELSTIGWASDFFVYYLWDLSLQLESEGRYEDAIRVLLTAITISKKKPTESLDMPSLLTDGAHIYRSWDREKYAEHCMTLLREAGDKAAELFGTHSREYAVVQNNRGAIEIDINRLQNAKESLDKAGDAFIKAGVPETDTDYLAYLDNRKCLEQRLSARPVVYRGILQRYPFLATRGDKFPFGDVRLLEDEIFVELAHKRARIEDDTLESRELEQAMKERMWELHRSIQEGNVLKRYPFLRAEVHGVHIATLRLEDDAFFMELVRQLGPGADATRINEVEHAVGEYVAHKARNVAMERAYVDRLEQDFSDTYEAYVNLKLPIPWIYILEDERVITLIDQIHKCSKSSGASVDLMQAQRQLGACVEEIERECFQWRKELAPWLSSSKRYSVSARDLAGDTHLNDLLCMRRLCASRGDANEKRLDVLLSEKLNAMWERAYTVRSLLAVDDEELHREFPFLDERPHHQRLSTLRIYEDPVVANLVERFRNGSGDGQLQAEMVVAVNYLAASHCDDKELRGLNYDMEGFTSGKFTIDTIPHMYDDYYMVLSQRRNDEAKSHTDDSPAAWELTHQMEQRVLQINSWARKVNANSYRKRQRLEGKYPFINRRHLGFTLDMLDVEIDDEFMSLVAARQQLTGIKPVALAALNRFSDQANQHVTELARRRINCMKEHQTKYPFIPSKMEGINTSTIYLGESKTFAQKAEQYSKIMLSKESNPELRQKRLVREMLNQVLAIARELNMRQNRLAIESEDLRERYPFLPDEPVDGILLVDVRPTQHPEFRTLSNQLDELRRDPVGNAAEIGAVEEKARALVVGLAEASAAATEAVRHQYPFLPKRVLGVPVGELPIGKDEVFTTLKGGDLSANKATLYSRAVQLVFNLHLSDAQLADADDAALSANPFLIYTTRKCFPLRHLRLQEDAIFTQLLDEYNTLLQRVCVDEEAAANARLRLATRADELALQEIKKVEEIRQAFHEIQSLTLEDIQLLERRGVLEQIKKSGTEGCTAALLDDVQKILEDDRKERIAKVQQMDEMRKMYPMLGRNADPSMLHNPDVAKLVGDHDELIEDISKNAGKLQQIKDQITRKAEVIKTMSPRNIKEREQPNEITESRSLTDIEEQVNEYIREDGYYKELQRQYQEVQDKGIETNGPIMRSLNSRMETRKDQVRQAFLKDSTFQDRERRRLLKKFKGIDDKCEGKSVLLQKLEDDETMKHLLRQQKSMTTNSPQEGNIEKLKEQRIQEIIKQHQAEEDSLVAAYPFLGRFVKGIPVGDLNLMADPEFANLASQYTRAATSGDAARCAQLKQALLEIASRTARDVRRGRLRRAVRAEGLRERYPFLPDEPVDGILLVDVRPTQHPEFRTLSNQLDELRRDPVGNAAEIGAVEEKARALVVGLAEASAAATEAVRHQYPFLPKRVLGVPVGELPIHDDAVLLQLEKRRTSEGKAAGAVEEEILKRVEELARDARVADRDRGEANEYVRACNPFLVYEDRKCVLLSDIPLGDDSLYQQLLGERLSALGNVEADADHLKRIEDALCSRADELALNELVKCMLLGKYPFLGSEDTDGLSSRLARDEEFQKMCARYDELMSDPVKNEEALQELERSMKERRRASAEEEAADLKRRGSSYYSGKIGASLSACALLPDTFRTVPLQELYLEDDPFFQEILVRYRELVSNDRKPETPLEKQLYEQLYRRAEQVAGDVLMHRALEERETARSTSRYPFLDSSLLNVCSRTMAFDDDELFCEHLKLYKDEAAKGPGVAGREKLNEAKAQLNNRLRVMMETHQAEEDSLVAAYPFLGRFVKGIPVGDLNLMADPEFANLASQYARAATSGDAARCAQLKQALLEIASRTARDVRRGRLRRAVRAEGLRERYPFLPDEPVDGILLVDVRPTQHPEFRTLSNQLDELRRDPVGNAAEIGAVEEKARALVVGLAEASAAATEAVRHQYPFLPKRVLGVPVGELPIHDDAVLLQLEKRRTSEGKAAGAVEEEILKRVEELARDARVADRDRGEANEYVRACNPFLVYEDRKCVLLSDIPLGDDSLYQQLLGERLSALGNVEADADHLKRIEDALCSRADELALNELVKCMLLRKYPFLGSEDTDGLSSRLARDEEFQKMCARYDELMSDPVKNEEALQELERNMKERVASFANSPKDSDGCGAVISFDLLRDPFTSSADAGGVQASFGGGTLASLNSSPQKVRLTSFEADPNERLSSVTLLPYGNAMECFKEAEVVSFDICMKRRDHKPRKAKRKKAHSLGGEAGGLGANEDVVGEDDTEDAGTRDGDTIDDNVAPAVREGGDTVSDRGDLSLLEVGELKEAGAGAAGSECVGNEERVTSAASEKLEEIVDSASTKEGAAAEGKPVGDDNLAARGTEEGATAEGKPVGDDNLAARGTEEGATAEGKPVGDDNLAARGAEEGATAEGKPVGDDNLAARGAEEGATAEGKPVGDDNLAARGAEEGATAEGATAEEGDTILGQEDETLACALRLEALRANIEELLVLESSSRAFHEKDERYERDQIMLAASDEARIIENERWARERLQHLVDDEEPPARNEVHVEEEDERRKLKPQEKLVLNFVRDIMLLKERETRERRACENDERIHLKGITTAAEESLQDALAAQKERETEESAVQKEGQRQEASSLIKSVIFAYRARRRLANRFRNRKAYTQKNAIEDLYGVEHNERLAIINEEKAALEELFRLGDFWDQKSEEESRKEFVELEKEEGLARHELIDDFMFQLKNLQRAYRKVVTKHQEATPSLQDLMRFEAREDALRAGGQCDASDTSFAGAQEDAVEVPGVERSDEMEGDYDECLSSGRYKGYVLDAIGSFLLKYERDLRKFRAVLERNKAGIAVEHELLKKSRDNATQDVAHGGSGASWVPTRPLPLSDLVRGPSAQYRRGRIADARGNKPVSGLNGVDRRTATAVDTARIGSSRKTR
uniref:Uncharacterized protein TCIL3000_8_4610 n=1 Tax=Trypanosoma congolense (strain IL3000) TaxID=1068625 RepID=G0US76_TRYCI|nr:unnamed protein product [Trypanosoma congolense IL3000]